ncbi:MAG: hypothetical protein JNG84_12100, partial [Archangium sp.]|nr:hypothetical protein [Archangium sp.]
MGQPKRKERETEAGETAEASSSSDATWVRPAPLSGLGLGVVLGLIALLNLPMLHYFLFRGRAEATAAVPYTNDFSDPASIDRDFFSTGGHWRLVNGELLAPGVKNNPLWLKAKLPQNVAVEFDVRSMSQEGDIKAEIFGDGSDHASGYVLIHGGWNNTQSVIARLDEHGQSLTLLEAEAARVTNGASSDLVQSGVYRANTRVRRELSHAP